MATDLSISVDIDPFIVIAEQELHSIGVGQGDNGVRGHRTLGVLGHVNVIHTEIIRAIDA